MSLRMTLVRPAAPFMFAAALFVGCNTTLTLDNDKLQQVIEDGLQQQAGVTATVTCPDNQPLQQGNTFQCTAVTQDGSNLQIQVTQTDASGNVNWQVIGAS